MAYKVFTNGSTLQASELNENLMQQSIATFSNAAARTAAITSPVEGQTTYLIDVDRYDSWNGSAWVPIINTGEWTSFTPTWANLTIGNGTYNRSTYFLVGKTAFVQISFTLGSTSAVTGDLSLIMPSFLTRKLASTTALNTTNFFQSGVANYLGTALSGGIANDFRLRWITNNGASTPIGMASTSATAPFTWATGHRIDVSLTYEVA